MLQRPVYAFDHVRCPSSVHRNYSFLPMYAHAFHKMHACACRSDGQNRATNLSYFRGASPAYPVEFSGMHMHATPILCLLHTWWQGHAHACSEYFSYLPRRRGTKWLACMCIPRVPHENIHGACTCMHTVITWAWTNSCNKYNPFYRIFIGYAHAYPVVCMCILCVLFLEYSDQVKENSESTGGGKNSWCARPQACTRCVWWKYPAS